MSKQTVAIDFDGVIHAYRGWEGEEVFHGPIPGALDFLRELIKKYDVVIHTTRNKYVVRRWLEKYGGTNWELLITSHKPPAIAYIDDRAVRFEGDFSRMFEEIERNPWWKNEQKERRKP